MTNVSQDDFIAYWSGAVATGLGLNKNDIAAIFSSGDIYKSNQNTRAMWKYAMAKGVSGTPAAFINGVKLDNMPTSANEWIKYLNDVYGL
jgi:2-hydroxychromene-2-carboxylate isomerase